MQAFIFDNDINALKINEYSILLVKEFKDLWDQNRNKCKEDKSGKERLRAMKELTFIYLMLDFKSPYFQFTEQDKYEAALVDSGLTEKDLKDPVFVAAYNKYNEIQNSDPFLSLIKTAYNTLYKMRVYLDNIDFETTDADGKPIYKPKDVVADIASIAKTRTQVKELEELHKKELLASESKVRGDAEAGLFDD